MTTAPRILIVFSSLFGANAELARLVEQTVTRAGAQGRTRGVPQLVLADRQVPQAQAPSATSEDLDWADGLSFILTDGKLPDTETIRTLLQTHLERFVMITQSVSGMPHAAHHASATAPSASRARATDVFG